MIIVPSKRPSINMHSPVGRNAQYCASVLVSLSIELQKLTKRRHGLCVMEYG